MKKILVVLAVFMFVGSTVSYAKLGDTANKIKASVHGAVNNLQSDVKTNINKAAQTPVNAYGSIGLGNDLVYFGINHNLSEKK